MKLKTCVGSSSDFSLFTSEPSSRQRVTKVCVCWRQVWWDVALTNQSSRYWWILIHLCKTISLTSLATTVNSIGAVDRPRVVLWTGRTGPEREKACTSWTDSELVCGSMRPWNLWRYPTPLPVARFLLSLVSPFWTTLCLGRCSRCSGPR